MTDSDRRDTYSSFNFRVVVDGVSIGEFSEVSGLSAEGDAIDYLNCSQPCGKSSDLAVPMAAILFCKLLRVASDIETNSGEAESDGNQECKRKKRAPHDPRPPAGAG
jgi:hypothetical protein